ncbi:MAG TPA: hypothetical protein VMF13_04365 [Luteitalea sp.]|nr:hypothetical protein [Luteitalea sp.]
MDGRDSIQSLLVLRKVTRAIAETVRAQMVEYLTVLSPLLRPKLVLGDYVHGGAKESAPRSEKAYKDVQAMYAQVAAARPFLLPADLTPPLTFTGVGVDITPVDYPHVIGTGAGARTITVRSPLTWVLSYSGFGPSRLGELLNARQRASLDLQQHVLSYVLMRAVIQNSPGLPQMFEALQFPLTVTTMPSSGELPITRIGVAISTSLPADDVILESAALTGVDAFEEVISVDDLRGLREPFKERLLEIARQQAPTLF